MAFDPLSTWTTHDGRALRKSLDLAFMELDTTARLLGAETFPSTGGMDPLQLLGEARTRLLYAVTKAAPSDARFPAAYEDVKAVQDELEAVEHALAVWRETETWPLTIEPSGPPRTDGDDDQADDDGPVLIPKTEWEDMVDAIKPRSTFGDFMSTTAGKISAGIFIALAARWVMK